MKAPGARWGNLFGIGSKPASEPKKRRGSGLTLAAATRLAREAGYRGSVTFSEWLERKRLSDRGPLVIDRLGDAYRQGMDRREQDDKARQESLEAKREKTREKAETAKQKREARSEQARQQSKLRSLDEAALQRHYARGGTLSEFLAQNPALKKTNPALFDRCVKAVKAKGGAANAYAVCTAAGTRKNPLGHFTFERKQDAETYLRELRVRGYKGHVIRDENDLWRVEYRKSLGTLKAMKPTKRNPATAAVEAFEEFHGHAPDELVTVAADRHHHRHLAGAGKLIYLKVAPIDGGAVRTLKGFKNALLAFNEQKNQLFIVGGDQALDAEELSFYGITEPHELETLGKVTAVGYHTRKDHLGKEGGEAVYGHGFRMTNENGKHVIVKITRYPDLIYRLRDEQLEFSGGSYTIRAEGIDK